MWHFVLRKSGPRAERSRPRPERSTAARSVSSSSIHPRILGGGPASGAAGYFDGRRVLLPVDEDHFDFGIGIEQLPASDDDVGDLSLLDAAQAVGHAVDLGGRKGHGADRFVARKSGVDRLLDGALQIARLFDAVSIESKLHA